MHTMVKYIKNVYKLKILIKVLFLTPKTFPKIFFYLRKKKGFNSFLVFHHRNLKLNVFLGDFKCFSQK